MTMEQAAAGRKFWYIDGMGEAELNAHFARAARESRKTKGEPTAEDLARVVDNHIYGWRAGGAAPVLPSANVRAGVATDLLTAMLRRV